MCSVCITGGATGGSNNGSGTGGRAQSDPTHQNSTSNHALGHQHPGSSAGAMDYESMSSHSSLTSGMSSGDVAFASSSSSAHGHSSSHTYPHPHSHSRKHHHHHSSHGHNLPSPAVPASNVNLSQTVLQAPIVTMGIPTIPVTMGMPHVHQAGIVTTPGYVYSSHSSLENTQSSSLSSGSLNMPMGAYAIPTHHHPSSTTQQTLVNNPHLHGTTTGTGGIALTSNVSGATSVPYAFALPVQSAVSTGLVNSQTTRQADDSPMVGVCVQQSPVASH